MRLAVVGSGPAAFYTVIRALQKVPSLNVTIFEKGFAPFGLVRTGVAPDHPEVKSCQERFTQLIDDNPKQINYLGNVEIGKDISLKQLSDQYNAVLIATGAQGNRQLGIENNTAGKPLRGVVPARNFVNWYNGVHDGALFDPSLLNARKATIIGNGNVALDIVRVLLSPLQRWKDIEFCDLGSSVYDGISKSKIEHIDVVGRRGLFQSAFTNKEFRELLNLVPMLPVDPKSELDVEPITRIDKKKIKLINGISTGLFDNELLKSNKKSFQFKFHRVPVKFHGDERVTAVEYTYNGKRVVEETDLVFTSIGYMGTSAEGYDSVGAQFDAKTGTLLRNPETGIVEGTANIFASGWAATGSSGAIAATMRDAFVEGDLIADYLQKHNDTTAIEDNEKQQESPINDNINTQDAVSTLEQGNKRIITWNDWKKLDHEEIRRGEIVGKSREKFETKEQALEYLK